MSTWDESFAERYVYATRDADGALSIVYSENRTDTLMARDAYWSNILGQLLDDDPPGALPWSSRQPREQASLR
jgi:hypothetical protein